MNELFNHTVQLPDTIEDLSRFVLVNEERSQALRAEIRAIKKVNLAKEVYKQKLAEAQEIGQITVEAAQKMGELLLQIQKQTGNQYTSATPTDAEKQKTKTEIISEMGMTTQQVSQYQQMAQNPEAVQNAIQKAIEQGDVVSRSQVMKKIRSIKEQVAERDRRISELENRKPEIILKEIEPSDYSDLKKKAREAQAYKSDYSREREKVIQKQQKILELEEQIKSLQEQTVREQLNNDLIAGAMYFIAQCGNFIRDVAGYVWIADKLADIPEKEREGYIRAAKAVQEWATVLLQNIGKDEKYGKSEI